MRKEPTQQRRVRRNIGKDSALEGYSVRIAQAVTATVPCLLIPYATTRRHYVRLILYHLSGGVISLLSSFVPLASCLLRSCILAPLPFYMPLILCGGAYPWGPLISCISRRRQTSQEITIRAVIALDFRSPGRFVIPSGLIGMTSAPGTYGWFLLCGLVLREQFLSPHALDPADPSI